MFELHLQVVWILFEFLLQVVGSVHSHLVPDAPLDETTTCRERVGRKVDARLPVDVRPLVNKELSLCRWCVRCIRTWCQTRPSTRLSSTISACGTRYAAQVHQTEFVRSLICAGARRNPATFGTNYSNRERRFDPSGRDSPRPLQPLGPAMRLRSNQDASRPRGSNRRFRLL